MSKKRVHEIAKELKNHGIELDNKDVVTELHSLGYDVKSHSSSLEDDQATAAIQKILEKRKPKAPAPTVAAKGFVVRRKVGGTVPPSSPDAYAPSTSSAEQAHTPESAYASEPAHADEVPSPAPAEAAPEKPVAAEEAPKRVEMPVVEAVPEKPVVMEPPPAAPVESMTAAKPPEATPAPVAAEPAAPKAEPTPVPPRAEPVAARPEPAAEPVAARPEPTTPAPTRVEPPAPAQPTAPAGATAPRPGSSFGQARDFRRPGSYPPPRPAGPPTAQAPQGPRPGGPGGTGTGPGSYGRPGTGPQGRPGTGPQQGGRPGTGPGSRPGGPGMHGGRPGQPRPGGPGMAPRPSSMQPSASASPGTPGQAGQPGQADPRQMRPTATQAVVISRPLIQVRRVTPSSTAHKNIPMAPGKKAIGEVREFKVVPDHLGRGRELVDVTKKKEGPGAGKKRTAEKDGTFTKQEISDLVWGRVSIPLRGKKRKPTKKGAKTQITQMAEEKKVIKLEEGITVSDLSQRMGVKTGEIIKKLMVGGKMVTANQLLDPDTAEIIASDYGWRVEKVGFEVEDHLPEVEEKAEDIRTRPPVVTVMGHVDHGKTSLLDAIRKANVAAGEAGGITQHIGAYTVRSSRGEITFLDTPGHEAFTAMRARGAEVTDIVVLVVAGDDGVMPQTVEAIKHAKTAEVPIVVAINKMDKEGANPDRVKKDLAGQELVPEDWGGDVIMVPVSARTKMGIDLLLENIVLQAEVLDLKANPARPAVGAVVEAKLDKGRGPVATVLVQEGTLRVGDAIVTGTHYGKVRAMVNDRGETVKEVLPGYSAEVIGLNGVPTAGDAINVVEDERAAKEIAEHRGMKARQAEMGKTARGSLESLLAKTKTSSQKELRVVLKADVQGSLEAVAAAVNKLSGPKVKVEIVQRGVGFITETDVMHAAASKGIVVGFNVRPESGAESTAKAQGVAIQTYSIIYELIDAVRLGMEGLLEPIRTEKKLGRAEVRSLFNVPKLGTIAGASVLEGTIKRTALLRLIRENKQVYSGKVASLRRFKDDVKEVAQGFECGIGIADYNDLKPGDIIEAYEIEETRPSLS
jgi:translation initiation factor IF-2